MEILIGKVKTERKGYKFFIMRFVKKIREFELCKHNKQNNTQDSTNFIPICPTK